MVPVVFEETLMRLISPIIAILSHIHYTVSTCSMQANSENISRNREIIRFSNTFDRTESERTGGPTSREILAKIPAKSTLGPRARSASLLVEGAQYML
jgi:hypothetical protein